jgi:membrane protease YdiL (CAAX protease family)
VIPGPDERSWRVWHALAAVGAGLAATVLAAALVGPEITVAEEWRVLLPAQTLGQFLVVGGLAAASARRRAALGPGFDKSDLVGIPIGIGLLVGGSLVLNAVAHLFLEDVPTQAVVESAASVSGFDIALVVAFAGFLGPIAEESIFRGVLLRALTARWGPRAAVWGSAAAFAGIHLLDPEAWLAVPLLFVVGVVLARQAVSTGRLARPVVIHIAFNLVSVLAVLTVDAG